MLDPKLDPKRLGHPVPPFETERGKKWITWDENSEVWLFRMKGCDLRYSIRKWDEIMSHEVRATRIWLSDRNEQIVMMMIGILHEEGTRLLACISTGKPCNASSLYCLNASSLFAWEAYARGEWEA